MSNSENARRYRMRKELRLAAAFNQIQELDLAFFGVKPDGTHVAIGYDGKPIPLLVRATEALPVVEQAVAAPPQTAAKLYVPKGITQPQWDKLREGMIALSSQAKVIEGLGLQLKKEPENADLYRKLRGLVQAIPDGPDWTESLPLKIES